MRAVTPDGPPWSAGPASSRPEQRLREDALPSVATLERLGDAVAEMHRSLSLDGVLRIAADRARSILGARHGAAVQLLDDDWHHAVRVASPENEDTGWPSRELDQDGLPAVVCRTNRARRADLHEVRERARAGDRWARRWAGAAWLAAPLTGPDGQNLGFIEVADRHDGGDFGPAEEAILVQLARMSSVAVENARLYEGAVDARSRLIWAAHIERLRAAELRAVIAAMGEAVCVCDARGRVTLTNPAADTLFRGDTPATYEDLLALFAWPDEPDRPDPTRRPVELRRRRRPELWVELRVYPVPGESERGDRSAEGGGRIAVMRDVTEARRARAARDAFVGVLSHELRTPITTIYAGARLLARGEPLSSTTRQELAGDVGAEAERLFRLVEDLLVMARAERGALDLSYEPVLIQRIAVEAIRLESARWPNQEFTIDAPELLPPAVGDATAVEQIMRNLLSNAAKYGAGQRVEVSIGATDGEIRTRVLDRGSGLQGVDTDDLFELFYRSPKTAGRAAGAGIGLFVCRQLAEAMGGRLWARAREGGGSEFGFALAIYPGD
jgi:signal transduction histidine kinase